MRLTPRGRAVRDFLLIVAGSTLAGYLLLLCYIHSPNR